MITTHGVTMPIREWSLGELMTLNKLTSSKASDWEKASLKKLKDTLRNDLLEFQNYSCAYCKREITTEIGRSELDHIIPCSLVPSFTFVRANLTLTCKRCNHSKKDHNPTTLPTEELRVIKGYINDSEKYLWIHPYVHSYEDHIRIIGDAIFEAVNESEKGLAVISKCKLDEISHVIDLQKSAKLKRARTPMHAIFTLVGEYPDESSDSLAKRLSENFLDTPFDFFFDTIEKMRGKYPISALILP